MVPQQIGETWKIIPGFDGTYEISYLAEIRRISGKGKRTITPVIKNGIKIVRLVVDGVRKEYRLHIMVALAFWGPRPKGKVAYHKNSDRLDNIAYNIGYISKSELGKKTGALSRKRAVIKLDEHENIIDVYRSAREAGRENFLSYQTVIDRCNGKCKSKLAPDGMIYQWEEREGTE